MRKHRRILALSTGIFAILVLAVAAFGLFLLTTRPGAALVVGYLEGKLPIDLTVGEIDGRLLGPLDLSRVQLTVSGAAFEVDRLEVDWRPMELLHSRRVHLVTVHADGVRVTLLEEGQYGPPADSTLSTQSEAFGQASLSLPIAIVLDDLQVINGSLSVSKVLEAHQVGLRARGSSESYTAEITAVAGLFDFPAARVSVFGTGGLNRLDLDSLQSNLLHGELRGRGSLAWMPGVTWQLAVEADSLAPADLTKDSADWPGRLSLAARTRGGLVDGRPSLQIDVDTLYGSLRGRPVEGQLSGGIDGSQYELSRVDLDWGQIHVDAEGDISRERLDLAFELEAPDLGAAVPRASGSVSASGKLAGSFASPQIAASLVAKDVSVEQFRLDSARAVVDLDWATRSRSEAVANLYGMEIASYALESAELELHGSKDQHELLTRIISNQANVVLRAGGRLDDGGWEGDVSELAITSNKVGDWRLEDRVRLGLSTDSIELDPMCLLAQDGKICVGGSWASADGWRASSSLERLPLALFDPLLPDGWSLTGELSGEFGGNGTATSVSTASVDISIDTGVLEYPDAEQRRALPFNELGLAIRADADSSSGEFAFAFADSSDVAPGRVSGHALLPPISMFSREAVDVGLIHAMRADWQLYISIDSLPMSGLDRLLPEAARPTSSRLNEGSLAIRATVDSLSADFAFRFADSGQASPGKIEGHASLPPVEVFSREALAEGLLDTLYDDWQFSFSIDTLPLSLFDRFLPETMQLRGSLNGSLAAAGGSNGELSANIEVIPADAVLIRTLPREVRTLHFFEPSIRMRVDSAGLWGEASLAAARPDSAPHLTLSGTVRLPEYTNLKQSLRPQVVDAQLAGALDLSLVDALVEQISGTAGRFTMDLAASGTLADMDISGQYRIQGETDVPGLGIQIRNIDLTAAAATGGTLEIRGSLDSGNGHLEIAGTAPVIPSREDPGRLTIRGDDFLAMQGDQTTLLVSPDLEVLWTGTTIDVTGDVTIPRATIEIIEIPESAVPVSDDVVFLGAEEQPSRPMDISANIRLILGSEILFKGFGFTTNVEGTLQLVEQPGVPTRGSGELVLREGVYRGYGQNLIIDPGRLIFAGPIDDPGLSVRAYRRATDGTRAGFLIGGTLKSPDLQVWSDPAMSESAVLSYVLFGRSAEQGTSAQQAQAGSAAAVLGGNILAMSMASHVGLDDARIEAGARQQDAAFYAGKYLSPKLYVAYGTGLFEPIDVIRVRYLISRKLTLQTETGTRDSGDILYRIEH